MSDLHKITAKPQADKALNSLKGILLGINFDKEVNAREINELQKWSQEHKSLVHRNPFKEFMQRIDNAMSNEEVDTDLIEDLFWSCQKYESDNYFYDTVTTDLQTLQGLCHGILSDGKIKDEEIFALDQWLDSNTHLNTYYPYDEIRSLVLSIVSDGKIDDEERLILKAFINQFINLKDARIASKVDKETLDVKISSHCTSNPDIIFKDKKFCITGALSIGKRKDVQDQIKSLGGITTSTVSKLTDYLIVGDNGNPAWAFACYGRKVETALKVRKEGHNIVLVHEFDFMDALEENS
jgi:NAD-dependent DNA ligase